MTVAIALSLAGCAPMKPEPKAPTPPRNAPAKRPEPAAVANLAAARELDQQGARAFSEGRYREALRYFEEAQKRGGPPAEFWNMARCQQKLDDLEAAARQIEKYLEQKDLSPGDREDARRELADLLRKPSRVTVVSTPSGAMVFLGDRRGAMQGRTPLTFEVPPGDHVLTLELFGHDTETERVSAKYGRAVVVETSLSR